MWNKANINQDFISKQKRNFQKGRPVEIFNRLADWTLQGGYRQELDATRRKLKVISNGSPAFSRKTVDLFLSGSNTLKLKVYIENLSALDKFSIYLANDTGYANFLFRAINKTACVEGWNTFYLDASRFSVTGTGTFNADIVSMQVRVEALAGQQAAVVFDSLERDEKQKPQLIFTFDDGWDSQYTEAFRRMKKRGIPGMIAVVPSLVNTPNYMTSAQFQEVYDHGWDLSNHTYNHINLKNVDVPTIRKEVTDCENWLIQQGYTRAANVVVYPQGGYKEEVITEMASRRAARSIVESIEAGVPDHKYKVKIRNVINTVTPATANSWIDEAITTGGTLVLLWHIITSPADTSTKYTPEDFQAIVDYAYSRRDEIDIITFTEYLERCGL